MVDGFAYEGMENNSYKLSFYDKNGEKLYSFAMPIQENEKGEKQSPELATDVLNYTYHNYRQHATENELKDLVAMTPERLAQMEASALSQVDHLKAEMAWRLLDFNTACQQNDIKLKMEMVKTSDLKREDVNTEQVGYALVARLSPKEDRNAMGEPYGKPIVLGMVTDSSLRVDNCSLMMDNLKREVDIRAQKIKNEYFLGGIDLNSKEDNDKSKRFALMAQEGCLGIDLNITRNAKAKVTEDLKSFHAYLEEQKRQAGTFEEVVRPIYPNNDRQAYLNDKKRRDGTFEEVVRPAYRGVIRPPKRNSKKEIDKQNKSQGIEL